MSTGHQKKTSHPDKHICALWLKVVLDISSGMWQCIIQQNKWCGRIRCLHTQAMFSSAKMMVNFYLVYTALYPRRDPSKFSKVWTQKLKTHKTLWLTHRKIIHYGLHCKCSVTPYPWITHWHYLTKYNTMYNRQQTDIRPVLTGTNSLTFQDSSILRCAIPVVCLNYTVWYDVNSVKNTPINIRLNDGVY